MSKRHELSDKEWERLKPLLPPQKPFLAQQRHQVCHRLGDLMTTLMAA